MVTLSNQFYKTLKDLGIKTPWSDGINRGEFNFLMELWYICDTKKEFIELAKKFKVKEGYDEIH